MVLTQHQQMLKSFFETVTGETIQWVVTETFHYIPVLDALKLILKPHVVKSIENEKSSPSGFLARYQDGQQYQRHAIFKMHPRASLR